VGGGPFAWCIVIVVEVTDLAEGAMKVVCYFRSFYK